MKLLALAIPLTLYAQFTPSGSGSPSRAVQFQVPTPPRSINQGSLPATVPAGPVQLSLSEAIQRGREYNLGNVAFANSIRHATGQRFIELSQLLPNISANISESAQQTNLAAFGFRPGPGFNFPSVVGPFGLFDARARFTQRLADVTAIRNYRASKESLAATELSARDMHDLVTLAVTSSYLQTVAAADRIVSIQAQITTAQAVNKQAVDRHNAGLAARIDVTRSQVELQTQQQRLTVFETDLAKQKIALARLIGLPSGESIVLTDNLVYTPLQGLTVETALERASATRADIKAAEALLRSAELTRKAAAAERYPSVEVNADYGALGRGPTDAHGTFTVSAGVRIPIFQGTRVKGDIEQAEANLSQRRAELLDLRGRIEADVRTAFLDLTAAVSQVRLAESSRDLARDALRQAQDRFAAGVADTIEVTQAQESVAAAEQDYIGGVHSHNLAKANLARALGQTDQNIKEFFGK